MIHFIVFLVTLTQITTSSYRDQHFKRYECGLGMSLLRNKEVELLRDVPPILFPQARKVRPRIASLMLNAVPND